MSPDPTFSSYLVYAPEFLSLALIHFLLVMAPGADFAVAVRQSVRHGRRAGICTALGFGAGTALHVVYTLLGVSALMQATPWLLDIVKWLGAAYLLYLGVVFLRSQPMAVDKAQAAMDAVVPGDAHSLRASFWTGFVTNATNPKATLFFLAMFTTLVSPATPLPVQVFYGLWMCAVIAAWFSFVAMVFTSPVVRQRFVRSGHWLERAMGLVLLGFAARLLLV
ncbi:LysE family translocator [Hylemonella sp. W303a]|uniref:LysE family translocator n=1 Tax=Hylemonella sp. W303a TaxID=3389873 RepID=UPI00396B1F0B